MAIAKNCAQAFAIEKFNRLTLFHFYHDRYIYDDTFAMKKDLYYLVELEDNFIRK